MILARDSLSFIGINTINTRGLAYSRVASVDDIRDITIVGLYSIP